MRRIIVLQFNGTSGNNDMRIKGKSIGKNYILNTIYQLMGVVIPLFTLPYLSRTLGAEGIGLYSFNNSIVSYFVLLAASGTGTFGQREIAYHQSDKKEVSRIFWEVEILRSVMSVAAVLAYFVYVITLGRDKLILLVLSFSLMNVILDISWMYSGLEEFSKLAIRFIIVKILYLTFIFTCINSPDDVVLYVAGEMAFGAFQYVSLWPGLRRMLVRVSNLHPFSHFKKVFILFIPSLAIQLYTVLDKTMLGFFSNGSYVENGYYEQAQGIIKSCLILVSSLAAVLSPKISFCHANNRKEEMKTYLYLSYRYVWFVTIALFAVVSSLSVMLIPLFLGPGFDKTIILVKICAPLFIIIGLSNITGLQYFVPCDHIKQHTISLIAGSIVNICLNLLFIPKFQSVGASVASVIAEICVTATQFVFVFRIHDLKIHKILSYSIKYWIAGLCCWFALSYLANICNTSWPMIVALVVLGVVLYIVFLLILRDKLVLDFIRGRLGKMEDGDG